MPFNSAVFKTRALTAVVFVIIMLLGLLWGAGSFLILIAVIHFGCWYELIRLLKKIHPGNYGYFLPLGLIYITMPFLLMIDLGFPNTSHWLFQRSYEDAFDYFPNIPCLIIFCIWINDTMAYVTGSLMGKTPFSKISPKKTWEGTIGGALLTILIIGFLGKLLPFTFLAHRTGNIAVPYDSSAYFIIAGLCAIFGTLGDLLESKIKRMAAVKDSGQIMPGHGGFLDRFDSLLAAIPFVWLYVYLF